MIKVDKCGVSNDCAMKNPTRPVCKETKEGLICVERERCFVWIMKCGTHRSQTMPVVLAFSGQVVSRKVDRFCCDYGDW